MPVRSRSTTAKHRRRPELSPTPSRAVVAASRGENRRSRRHRRRPPQIPTAFQLTGLGPILVSQVQPRNLAHSAQRSSPVQQLFRAVLPSGGQSDPVRSDPIHPEIFFILQRSPSTFRNR
ncbi:hypothetical protein CRG98_023872 [Punica granatum]|uniref:Uncharacterized protein n=1 Tax=Punica granatum TaxID=22663 RepID=A0A2I0JIK4_PUNGR|nr:hypothetical protein CRG98_023872 [Punica granatum]